MNMQQHSHVAGRLPNAVSDVRPDRAFHRAAEVNDPNSLAGEFHHVQSDDSNPDGPWNGNRKQLCVKRTLTKNRTWTEFIFGTVCADSITKVQTSRTMGARTPDYEQDQHEDETSYTVYPATWLIRLGIQYGFCLKFLSSSAQGWQLRLNACRRVPDEASIFKLCRRGDISAIKSLLSSGRASARDTDSTGRTPLHVSLMDKINAAYCPGVFAI